MTLRVDGQIPWVVELPVLGALLPKLEEKSAVKCEDLDTVVVLNKNIKNVIQNQKIK